MIVWVLLGLLWLVSPSWALDYRSNDSGTIASGTALLVNAPSGTVAGDLVLIGVSTNINTTIADNNGGTPFTEDITDFGLSSMRCAFFSRRIQSGDPSSYAFTLGASTGARATAVTLSNPDPTTIYDDGPTGATGSNTTPTSDARTTSSDNAVMLQWYLIDGGGHTFSSKPGGYTEIVDLNTNTSHWVGYRLKTPAGSESAQAITISPLSQWCAISVAIEQPVVSASFGPLRQRTH